MAVILMYFIIMYTGSEACHSGRSPSSPGPTVSRSQQVNHYNNDNSIIIICLILSVSLPDSLMSWFHVHV